MSDFMLGIDLSFEVAPAVGKTISRIYRDTRFSKDKSPFHDCAWITFKRSGKDWSRYIPGYFLEIAPKSYRYGMGFYEAAPDLMARFRERIEEDPESFVKAVGWLDKQKVFTVEGERYKRPTGQDKPEPIRTWCGYRSFYLTCNRTIDDAILSPKFPDRLMNTSAWPPRFIDMSTASPRKPSASERDERPGRRGRRAVLERKLVGQSGPAGLVEDQSVAEERVAELEGC
jgi:uncharacterized protein (TIGR02453 family)